MVIGQLKYVEATFVVLVCLPVRSETEDMSICKQSLWQDIWKKYKSRRMRKCTTTKYNVNFARKSSGLKEAYACIDYTQS